LVSPISVSFGLQLYCLPVGTSRDQERQIPFLNPLLLHASWQVLSIVVVVEVEMEEVVEDTFLQTLLTHWQSYPSGGDI